MLAAAVVVHGLLLLVVLPARQPADRTALELQWVELSRPASPDPAPSESVPPDAKPPPETEPEPRTIAPSMPATIRSAPTSEPADQSASAPSAQRLRELALIAGRAQTTRTPPPRPELEGFAIPQLPGQAGWLSDHVGTVNAHVDSWLEPDGTSAARVVTTAGQVYCGRARAPTAAEEFNPWMSAVVTTWRSCGRKRPEAIDRTNPWVRGSGSARD